MSDSCPLDDLDERQPAKKVAPPLKWHGGKRYLADWILEKMPRHLHYVEPFFGGGQVLFARDPADPRLGWPHLDCDGRKVQGVSEVVNDINRDLMGFYAVLRDPETFGQLQHRLLFTNVNEAEYENASELLTGKTGDRIERAAALFIIVRQSRQALMKDFVTPVTNRLRGERQEHVNAWCSAVDGLLDAHYRMRDVLVLCRPAVEVIRSQDGEGTLFYCDPPYVHETRTARKAYGENEMTDKDHRELLDVLKQVRGKVILSGLASKLYDDALSGWQRHTRDLPNNAASGSTKRRMTEVLWCNF